MPYPAKKSNDLARAASALRKALKTGAEALEDGDPAIRLKAVHAVSTAAGTLAKLAELSDLEARLQALEQALLQHQGPLSLRRQSHEQAAT
jgi:hypothetical protein